MSSFKKADYFKFAIVRNPFERLVSAWSDFTQNRLVGRIQNNYKAFLQSMDQWDDDTLCIYRMWEADPKKFQSYDEFCDYYRQAYDWNVDELILSYFDILADVDGGEFLTIKKNKGLITSAISLWIVVGLEIFLFYHKQISLVTFQITLVELKLSRVIWNISLT